MAGVAGPGVAAVSAGVVPGCVVVMRLASGIRIGGAGVRALARLVK